MKLIYVDTSIKSTHLWLSSREQQLGELTIISLRLPSYPSTTKYYYFLDNTSIYVATNPLFDRYMTQVDSITKSVNSDIYIYSGAPRERNLSFKKSSDLTQIIISRNKECTALKIDYSK